MKIVSLFTGCGGLDLGFCQAGFEITWMNEFDKVIIPTLEHNFPGIPLDIRDIHTIPPKDIPNADGIIGSPPCQSWSSFGAKRGIGDARGQLFFEYARVLRDKQPMFFVAENVSGMLMKRHAAALKTIMDTLEGAGYAVECIPANAQDFGVPQDRARLFFVGFRRDLGVSLPKF